jgi:3-oxoacyl-[acyl-carrier protein] reductase
MSSDAETAPGVALVTGASRGIGAATARLLAQSGWAVAVNYLRGEAEAVSAVRDIVARGGAAVAAGDVTDTGAVLTMVNLIERELGPVDVLVCNAAGISDPGFGPVLDVTPEAVETIVLAQLRAVLTPARAVVPAMVARRRGSLVVVSSQLARSPKPGFSALSIAKGAVEATERPCAATRSPAMLPRRSPSWPATRPGSSPGGTWQPMVAW